MNRLLVNLLKKSELFRASQHESHIWSNLTVVIDNQSYLVVYKTKIYVYQDLTLKTLCRVFKNGLFFQVHFVKNNGEEIVGFIRFYNIPLISPLSRGCCIEEIEPTKFDYYFLNPQSFFYIEYAKLSDQHSPIFALGCFKYRDFIKEFTKKVNLSPIEYQIHVLWEMLVKALHKIEYFHIFDINHFQSIVLRMFLRMFNQSTNSFIYGVSINLFLTFIEKLLSNSSFFMIFGDKYRAIQGKRPPIELINLFSDPDCPPPLVNFVSPELVGFIMKPDICILLSLKTLKVCEITLLHYYDHGRKIPPDVRCISNKLFGTPQMKEECYGRDFDISCIPRGVLIDDGKMIELVVFKMGSFLNVFVKGSDGSFKWFCPHFFLMFHLFKVGGITEQLTNYFDNFLTIELNDFILALCDCGFRTIFYSSAIASIQEIKYFIDSDFGVLLRQIIHDLNEFPERLYDHYSLKDKNDGGCFSSLSGRTVDVIDPKKESRIRENCQSHIEFLQKNKYIQQLRLIFETILEKLKGRPNLEPEVQEFISSLEQVFNFLTPKN